MIKIAILGFLVGLDNLQVVSGLGLFGIDRKRKWILVFAFAFFEMCMPLLGLVIGQQLQEYTGTVAELLGPLILFVLGSAIIIMELMGKEINTMINNPWMLLGLPLFMSFDNLFAGVGLGVLGFPILLSALVIGIFSGGLSFLGLFLGDKIRKYIPGKAELLSGSYMIGLSIFFLLFD
ncbi:MAG: putative Mn2+ efflux pump MntP [Saprospiraceae bacterium]|jgi:putative Mn2+ efflux pump MntP